MKPGSVIVDLAVERGGNCEAAKPGEVVDRQRREDRRPPQRAGPPRGDRLEPLRRNLYAFVETLIDKASEGACRQMGRRARQGDLLTRDGAVVHSAFQPEA